ncbi:MAG: preprotein translocase subunit SecG [Streptococcaceae bacterium]|jgi:preprotein translocase subunit SecG|nr:preprotein translocase subunit SecG [Streptococcaceae bacterium]
MEKTLYNALLVALLVLSVIIVLAILLQPSRQDGSAGLFSGGGSDDLFERHKARGFEAVMQRFTAILITLWLAVGFVLVVLSTK